MQRRLPKTLVELYNASRSEADTLAVPLKRELRGFWKVSDESGCWREALPRAEMQRPCAPPGAPIDPAELARPVQPAPDELTGARGSSIYSVVTVMPRHEIAPPPDEWCEESTKPRGQLVNVAAQLAKGALPSIDLANPGSTQFMVFARDELGLLDAEQKEAPPPPPPPPPAPAVARPKETGDKPGSRIPMVTIIAFAAAAVAWAMLLLLTLS